MPRKTNRRIRHLASIALLIASMVIVGFSALSASAQISVTTYHYDNARTGWDRSEATLTPANVNSKTFGLLHTVELNDQVDAQPLVVPGVQITAGSHKGAHDVVYVATESNTVYAIDAHSGAILLTANLGTPVTYPLGCNNNGPNVGITSTPVIDPVSGTIYAMVYNQEAKGPAYKLHALDLGSLKQKGAVRTVVASEALNDGSKFAFNAVYERQRSALLLANGSLYAGFASFCDFGGNLSRGWLLGWTADGLVPFPSNELTDLQATDSNSFFLSSIWMSGYGPAVDDEGNILFVTGNSEPRTYDGVTNLQESVVKVSSTLNSVVDLFTPQNQVMLDDGDVDFGSGGVLVLPDQPGSLPHLAVAAGKDGSMFLMNEDNLGRYSNTKNNVLGTYQIGGCWCGESYYVDPVDGLGRVVTSGGTSVEVWRVQTSPAPALKLLSSSLSIGGEQEGGFFTTVSSNGKANPIIWAISRPPNDALAPIYLYAFNPDAGKGNTSLQQLIKVQAGAWPNFNANANLVPVVANGEVFVASNKQLQIFGLVTAKAKK